MSNENALLSLLVERIQNDSLVLPSLPEIALRIRKMAEDPNVNLNQMADIISHDPAMSARMMKIANSAFLGRSVPVSSLQQAVTRIGLRYIKNIATAMAIEQLFVSHSSLIKDMMGKVWQETLEVAAVALATMQLYNSRLKSSPVNFDTMTLAGLIHNIGALPILTEAEKHLEQFGDKDFITGCITDLAGGIGGSILRKWEFPDELIEVAELWNTRLPHMDKVNYLDFIRIATIQKGFAKDKTEARIALKSFADRGLITDVDFSHSPEFVALYQDMKQLFV
ncbi:MAG: HDOD domain-containing protein [Gammaproteobacteria bacterium]|nr:HDOD domain-containing protein [Gammaproteobacteria bacterium]MBU2057747.1 HDOD domain-containing protein [Gammaproteobacteria bacterium]MBU2174713.1 HDOD domain-containing protein [Gammaproteobacteria bacterium]MBU2248970.1 HDOD domain-containing protein [Gammaproteobacteria bacterium]MBU2345178.1 HDOD domain-containing protein [Gammaproteobacteria bacterium]